jgi:hypothetical protein
MTSNLTRLGLSFYTASVEMRSDKPLHALVSHLETADLTHLASRRIEDGVHVVEFSMNQPGLDLVGLIHSICDFVDALRPEHRSDWDRATVRIVSLAFELDENQSAPWMTMVTIPCAVTERVARVGAAVELVFYCAHSASG